jgi:prepilin-type processing-associated H-X9-DG protein
MPVPAGTTQDLERKKFTQRPSGAVGARMIVGDEEPYAELFDWSGDELQYHGWAEPGTATSAAGWRIAKYAWSAGNLVNILWADGNLDFDNVWDDRASLSYA